MAHRPIKREKLGPRARSSLSLMAQAVAMVDPQARQNQPIAGPHLPPATLADPVKSLLNRKSLEWNRFRTGNPLSDSEFRVAAAVIVLPFGPERRERPLLAANLTHTCCKATGTVSKHGRFHRFHSSYFGT